MRTVDSERVQMKASHRITNEMDGMSQMTSEYNVERAKLEASKAEVISEIERGRRAWRRLAWVSGVGIAAALILGIALRPGPLPAPLQTLSACGSPDCCADAPRCTRSSTSRSSSSHRTGFETSSHSGIHLAAVR